MVTLAVFVVLVIRQFVAYEQGDDRAAGQPYRKSGDIDDAEQPITQQVSPRD